MELWERDEFQRRIETLERKLEDAELSLHLLEDDRQKEFEEWEKRQKCLEAEKQVLEERVKSIREKWRVAMERMKAKEKTIDTLKLRVNSLKEHLRFLGHKDDVEIPEN